jgi:large subunit ribosomal protein LP0
MAAISMELGIPSELTVPHLIVDAFKNLAAIGLATGYEFKQLKSANQATQAVKEAPVKKEAPKETKKEVKPEPVEEPEEDVDMGGLFD